MKRRSERRHLPAPGAVDPGLDLKTSVRKQVNALEIEAFFDRLAQLMKTNPPTANDAPIVARMAKIGLVPGKDFDPTRLGSVDKEASRVVPKLALLEMGLHLKKQKTTNERLYFIQGVGVGRDLPLRFSSRGSSSPVRRRDAQRRPFALR